MSAITVSTVVRPTFVEYLGDGVTDPADPPLVWITDEESGGTRDHYGPSLENTSLSSTHEDRPTQTKRRNTRIAPPTYEVESLPKSFLECGCGRCHAWFDPLSDGRVTEYAADHCPSPRPMSVKRAREVYARYIGSRFKNGEPSKVNDSLKQYWTILEADRQYQEEFDLTTVMVSLRLSPLDDDDQWIHPLTLVEMLYTPRESVMNAFRYHLDEFEWKYVAVTAGTEYCATPHIHFYFWIDDPYNEVERSRFQPAVEKHIEKCPNAYKEHHLSDDETGAISIEHSPPICTDVSEEHGIPPTRGAVYVASQLPHLALRDHMTEGMSVSDVELETGAIAWASPHKWFSKSQGLLEGSREA